MYVTRPEPICRIVWKPSVVPLPLVGVALHDGHRIRPALMDRLVLTDSERLREEDPFTACWLRITPIQVKGLRSRFEVDLNRPRALAVYRTPEQAWGLRVWKKELNAVEWDKSLRLHDVFYESIRAFFDACAKMFGKFVIYDLHSYNHRRAGPVAPPADPMKNPDVNIGTGTMDRIYWAPVVDTFIEKLGSFDFGGRALDVGENVNFKGGHFSRWVHEHYPRTACSLSIEFKKFFMDEWTGKPNRQEVNRIRQALQSTIANVISTLRTL